MNYAVIIGDGEWRAERKVIEVSDVRVEDGVYILTNKNGAVLFSAPVDSLIYLEVE